MKIKGILSTQSLLVKAIVLFGIALICVSLFTSLSFAIAHAVFKIDPMEPGLLEIHGHNQNVINTFKVIQGFSALGLFVIAPLLAAMLFSFKPTAYLNLNIKPAISGLILTIIILIVSTPLINYLLLMNQQMSLPSWLSEVEQWMQSSEEQAAKLTESFLSTTSLNGLFVNLIVIALIPAIGEELFFRGMVQKMLIEGTGKKHLAVIVCAAVFSAFHMQFYGFLPRFALGILLGYTFLWSGSLWVPIIAHFFNNGAAVIMAFFAARNGMPFNQDTIGTGEGEIGILTASIILTAAGLFLLYKIHRGKTGELSD